MPPKVSDAYKSTKRQDILAAARRAFLAKGFHATVMQDVIAESGMSRGGVYAYFANKEDLLLALLEDYDDEVMAGLQTLLTSHATVWEAVEELARLLVERAGTFQSNVSSVFYEYFIVGWRHPGLVAFHSGRNKGKTPPLVAFLQAGVNQGEFEPRVPLPAIVDFLGNQGDGMNLSGLLLGAEGVEVDAQLLLLRQTLHHLLGVKAPFQA